jgi:hypothetical protein
MWTLSPPFYDLSISSCSFCPISKSSEFFFVWSQTTLYLLMETMYVYGGNNVTSHVKVFITKHSFCVNVYFFLETQFSMKRFFFFFHLGAQLKPCLWSLIFHVLIFENTLKKKRKRMVNNIRKSLYLNFSHILICFSQCCWISLLIHMLQKLKGWWQYKITKLKSLSPKLSTFQNHNNLHEYIIFHLEIPFMKWPPINT